MEEQGDGEEPLLPGSKMTEWPKAQDILGHLGDTEDMGIGLPQK